MVVDNDRLNGLLKNLRGVGLLWDGDVNDNE
jgi:hypothetical protein